MNTELIINRLEEYNEKTLPVADFYNKQHKFASLNAIGDEKLVFERLSEKVEAAMKMLR
jgi:adenylate kinase